MQRVSIPLNVAVLEATANQPFSANNFSGGLDSNRFLNLYRFNVRGQFHFCKVGGVLPRFRNQHSSMSSTNVRLVTKKQCSCARNIRQTSRYLIVIFGKKRFSSGATAGVIGLKANDLVLSDTDNNRHILSQLGRGKWTGTWLTTTMTKIVRCYIKKSLEISCRSVDVNIFMSSRKNRMYFYSYVCKPVKENEFREVRETEHH